MVGGKRAVYKEITLIPTKSKKAIVYEVDALG